MRIISFLPSSTEMIFALGLGNQLVGVTHECDYPPQAKEKAIVVKSAIPVKHLTQKEIDAAVRQHLNVCQSLYQVDELLLKKLSPDLIITQDLCQVCAPSGNEVQKALNLLPNPPKILWLTPTCLEDIFQNILDIGRETQHEDVAQNLVKSLRGRVERVRNVTQNIKDKPKVFFMEWLDPIFNGGHWIGELIEIAGGSDVLSIPREPSKHIEWQAVLDYSPEILILSPCGMNLKETTSQAGLIQKYPNWESISAVRENQVYPVRSKPPLVGCRGPDKMSGVRTSNGVYAVDANAYYARPGPRIVDGLEILAKIFHPTDFPWITLGSDQVQKVLF